MRFHHIGIFVDSLERGCEEMGNTFDVKEMSDCIEDELIGVKIRFLKDASGICYELVAPLGDSSPVTGVIQRGHSFLNHLAYSTDDFDRDMAKLREQRMVPLGPAQRAKAFNGRRVAFFLTKLNYIIEIIEEGS